MIEAKVQKHALDLFKTLSEDCCNVSKMLSGRMILDRRKTPLAYLELEISITRYNGRTQNYYAQ